MQSRLPGRLRTVSLVIGLAILLVAPAALALPVKDPAPGVPEDTVDAVDAVDATYRRHVASPSGDATRTTDLIPETTRAGDRYGASVATLDDMILVGAPGGPDRGGHVDVWERASGESGGWAHVTTLEPLSGEPGDGFGSSMTIARVAQGGITRDHLSVIGAPGSEAAYVFTRGDDGSWTEVAKLRHPGGKAGTGFGHAMATDGDRILVAAPQDPVDGVAGGAVYGWAFNYEEIKIGYRSRITADAPEAGARFGWSLALSGDRLVVGEPGRGACDDGAIHGFRYATSGGAAVPRSVWKAPAGVCALFGESVAIAGDALVVGAPGDDEAGENAGAVYVYPNGVKAPGFGDRRKAMLEDIGIVASGYGSTVAADAHLLVASATDDAGNALLHVTGDFTRPGGPERILRFSDVSGLDASDMIAGAIVAGFPDAAAGGEQSGHATVIEPDLDRDGVTDANEARDGTDPLAPDTDGDGWDDGAERGAGTDPRDPTSFPAEPPNRIVGTGRRS